MALRGRKPEEIPRRLKALMFGPAGVGKTMAAIQMPRPYIIDGEAGTVHYGDTIDKAGGAVFQTTDLDDVMREVRSLLTEKHDFRTLVLDPITPIFDTTVEEGERAVGTEWGRHYGYANTRFKRLFAMLGMLDMNVIMTAHAKNLYGDDLKVIGSTFDGWKKLDYLFDLVFELQRRGRDRWAVVRKTRIAAFPDLDSFQWSIDALAERYGRDNLEREAAPVNLASVAEVAKLRALIDALNVPDESVQKWLKKFNAESLEEMTADAVAFCVAACEKKIKEVSK